MSHPETEAESFRKLLKPKCQYNFGRKPPADLVLADKTVSRESAAISVGPFHPGEDEELAPTVTIHALKRMIRVISADHEEEWQQDRDRFIGNTVQPNEERLLSHGDTIVLSKSAPSIKVLWLPLVFFPSLKVCKEEEMEQRTEDCQSLGITLHRSKQLPSFLTHLILPSTTGVTPVTLQATVLSAHLVTIAFLDEVIRRGKLSRAEPEALETECLLPKAGDYMPEVTGFPEKTADEVKKIFAPQPSRERLLIGTTLLFVHGIARMSKTTERLIEAAKMAGARVISENATELEEDESILRTLRKHKSQAQTYLAESGEAASQAPDEGLAVITTLSDIEAARLSSWQRITRKMNVAMPSQNEAAVSLSILHQDARKFLNELAEPIDEVDIMAVQTGVPSTAHIIEPQPMESQQTQQIIEQRKETTPPPVEPIPAASSSTVTTSTNTSPRKPKRRADMPRRDPLDDIFGFGPSMGASYPSSSTLREGSRMSSTDQAESASAPPRPKRRDGIDSKRRRISEAWRNILDVEGAGSNPAAATDHSVPCSTVNIESQSRTRQYRQELDEADRLASQRESPIEQRRDTEPIEKQEGAPSGKGNKRQAPSPAAEDPERSRRRQKQSMEDEEMEHQAQGSPEPRNMENVWSAPPLPTIIPEQEANRSGSHETKDTDEKFLQAMASSRKSKKGIDQFDQDFNSLRIAKPRHITGHHGKVSADEEDPEYRAWQQMTASDFDINAAGNFVQVDFVPLVYARSERNERNRERHTNNMLKKWQGQPNFKKFRAKQPSSRTYVTVDIDEGLDYGMGNYASRPVRAREMTPMSVQDDGKDDSSKQLELSGLSSITGPTRKQTSYTADPFSDDEERDVPPYSSRRSTQTIVNPRSSRHRTTAEQGDRVTAAKKRNAAAVVVSSDEEADSGTFSGFRKKRRGQAEVFH